MTFHKRSIFGVGVLVRSRFVAARVVSRAAEFDAGDVNDTLALRIRLCHDTHILGCPSVRECLLKSSALGHSSC
jgi:hypothetical protein